MNTQIHFNIKVIQKGDAHGRDDCLVHEDEYDLGPLVQFYDPCYTGEGFTPLGQFVASYYLSTLEENEGKGLGLSMNTAIPEWSVDAGQMTSIVATAHRIVNLKEIA